MSVRFVIGRAGTGKTHRCVEAIRTELAREAIDGPRLILLVPEQAGLQMERAILGAGRVIAPGGQRPASAQKSDGPPTLGQGDRTDEPNTVRAAHRAEVLSFQRLALRVLDATDAPSRQAISEPARAMVLRHLVASLAKKLRYYRRSAQFGGLFDKLAGTVVELIEESISPDQIAAAADQADLDDPAQRAKLHDLRIIYEAYLSYLGDNRLDPSQHLQLARQRLGHCKWIRGASLWMDGFASLSGEEQATLVDLARLCGDVEITIMMDPSLATEAPPGENPQARLFDRIRRTWTDLHESLTDAGVPVSDPVLLNPSPPHRFEASPSLARLEHNLGFGGGFSMTHHDAGNDGKPQPELTAAAVENVELVSLPSRRIEVDYAVSRVQQWVANGLAPYRYRDTAIIVRDFDPYGDLLAQALRARNIPFFIDRRRSIAHHALVELVRALAAVLAERLSLDSVRLLLKTGLLPISRERVDELENYLLAHGIFGLKTWREVEWTLPIRTSMSGRKSKVTAFDTKMIARVNETRRKMLALLEPWLAMEAAAEGATGPKWTDVLLGALDRLHVGETLAAWATEAEDAGDIDLAQEHRQVWSVVTSFLDDVAFAFADVTLTTAELADVLETGLSNLTLGLAPPMIDQVLVGSIDRSRHPNIKAAVVLGFNDGVFPLRPTEDSILNDTDRDRLRENGLGLKPPTRQRVLDESLLVYTAMTRASDAVVVTYADTDEDGRALRPSPYVDMLRQACPGLEVHALADPNAQRASWDILCMGDALQRLTSEFRSRPPLRADDKPVRRWWNEFYESLREPIARDESARRALSGLQDFGPARLSPSSVENLVSAPLRVSVSQLETYASCPFQHFAKHGLKLRERAEAELAPVDVGEIHHAILEDFVGRLSNEQTSFQDLSEGEVLDRLAQSQSRVADTLPTTGAISNARDHYLLRRSASQLARMMRAQRALGRRGKTKPKSVEVPFGFDTPGSLPSLTLSTPAGRRVFVRGYIDRVDLAELGDELLGVVIDYKRTPDKKLRLDEVYHGLSLQLLGYLAVLAEQGTTLAGRPIRPLAALYVSLAPRYRKVDHPSGLTERKAALPGAYRPRGVIATEAFGELDPDDGAGGWSHYYSMFRAKDGSVGNVDRSDGVERESLGSLIDHTKTKLGELADGILDGDIKVHPYKLRGFSPCRWCVFQAVCRFESGISDTRFLETLTRSEVFGKLRGK